MRNSYTYKIDSAQNFINKLVAKSKSTNHISILLSNQVDKGKDLPKKYINYDLIAGVEKLAEIKCNENSLNFHYTIHYMKNIQYEPWRTSALYPGDHWVSKRSICRRTGVQDLSIPPAATRSDHGVDFHDSGDLTPVDISRSYGPEKKPYFFSFQFL